MTELSRRTLPLALATPGVALAQPGADPLPSWREGPRRRALLDFVAAVTTEGGPDFVPAPARVAVFDNDGTLWVEQPVYVQLVFVIERLRRLAPANPGSQQDAVLRAALAGDARGALAEGTAGLLRLVATAQVGSSPEAFEAEAAAWLAQARHPPGTGPTRR